MGDFEDLSPEDLQQLIELGILDDSNGQLADQIAQAQSVRGQQGPGMRGNGRIMVAANPLEFAVDAYQKYKAGKDIDNLRERQQANLGKQTQGRLDFAKRLFNLRSGGGGGYGPMPRDDDGVY